MQGIERGENSDDWRLIVGRGAGVNAPVVLIGVGGTACGLREGNAFASSFDRFIAQHRFEGSFVGPRSGIDGLAVVVGVENHGSRRTFGVELCKHHWSAALNRQEMRFDAAGFKHFLQTGCVFFHIRCVARDIGNGEKLAQFAYDAVFVRQSVRADFFDDVLRGRQDFLCFDFAADGKLCAGGQGADEQRR